MSDSLPQLHSYFIQCPECKENHYPIDSIEEHASPMAIVVCSKCNKSNELFKWQEIPNPNYYVGKVLSPRTFIVMTPS